MKTIRNLSVCLLMILLVGCGSGGPASLPAPGPASDGGTEAGALSGARPTLASVPSVAARLPSFTGLYWTPDLRVQARGEAIDVVAGLPCTQVIDLLSSGEWRLTKQVVNRGQIPAFFPTLALMELGDRALLLEAKDLGSGVSAAPDTNGELAPTNTPAFPAASASPLSASTPSCQVFVEPLTSQPVEAHGVEEAQGQAFGYPLPMGCTLAGDTITVDMFYEGPGDLRASMRFNAPNSTGEHPVGADGLSVSVSHSSASVMDLFAQIYAGDGSGAPLDVQLGGTVFEPTVDTPGKVRIQSIDPLAGEISLDGLADPDGNPQSFRAGFRCDNLAG